MWSQDHLEHLPDGIPSGTTARAVPSRTLGEGLRERIAHEGKHLGRGVLKVDSFLSQQIDPQLMQEIGQELAQRLGPTQPNKILTVETSGILPACAAPIENQTTIR